MRPEAGRPETVRGAIEPWQVLDSELVVDSPWMRVHRQRVRTAEGHELAEYFVVDTSDIVVILALDQAGNAILVHQYRHGIGSCSLELPAGMLDAADDDPAAAAARELLEETGYRPARIELLGRLFPSTARQRNQSHCFLALGCQRVAEPHGDPAEQIEVRLLRLDELRAAAQRGELPSQTSIGCLFLGLERLRELDEV